jgi:hypothetical protein
VKYAPEREAVHLLPARTYQALGAADKAKREFAEVRQLQAARIHRKPVRTQAEEPPLRLEP